MKFAQLIEDNMKNRETFFLRNYKQNVLEKLVPDPFTNNQNWGVSGSAVKSFMHFVFIAGQTEGYQNVLKLSSRPLASTSYKAFFLKNPEAWN